MDFIAIGDTVVDEFIRLKEGEAHVEGNGADRFVSMRWGDKIPYDFSVLVPAVGNAANAAVVASRLGLSTGFISNIGKDRFGENILAVLTQEKVSTEFVTENDWIPTNHHFVLWYGAERTILIRHEAYPYRLPENLPIPKWVYLSSLGEASEAFHTELATWLTKHSEIKLAFQPGTFQITMGREKLASIYSRAEIVACNKEEAELILGVEKTEIKELLRQMHALGPKIVLITDGQNGAYASDGTEEWGVPMYPDKKPPLDRTGAGDAMTSTIVVALALDKPLVEALLWGPINAMSVVQEIGAQKGLLTRETIEKYLASAPSEYKTSPL